MGGRPGEDPTGGPDEIYVVSPDAPVVPVDDRSDPSRRPAVSGRQAALLAVVGLLAFGVGVGVGTHRGDGPTATAGETTAASTTTRQPAEPTPAGQPSSSVSHAGATTAQAGSDGDAGMGAPASTATLEPWPTAPGICGYDSPVPLISGTLPLGGETGLTVMAGGAPSRIRVDDGSVGEVLFAMPVNELAADAGGMVAITTSDPCASDPESATIAAFRLDSDGALSQVYPAARPQQRAVRVWGIIAGGHRTWLVASPPYDPDASEAEAADAADVDTLIAADHSGDSVTLPTGFTPLAGWRDLIAGSYVNNAAGTDGPIQIYDLARGGIVAQIAAASPQIVASGEYMAWIDASCQVRCTAHRYEWETGQQADIPVALASGEYGGVGSLVAMSPDGRRVAMVTYDAAADSRYQLGHPGGPARFSILDLESGELTILPGVVRAPKTQAGMAFSPDGQWLVVAVNNGVETQILLYDHDLRGPYDPGINVPASGAWDIPLVVE